MTDNIDGFKDTYKKHQETSPDKRFIKFENEVIGKGSFKKVYKAYDSSNGIEVAWNEVEVDDLSESFKNKVFDEINILKNCGNRSIYIIKFYDFWFNDTDNKLIFITEIASSGNLRDFVNKVNDIKLKTIKNWCKQILYGIKFLHENNVVHRDIKCDNIFINGNTGKIFIGDFGLAKKICRNTHTILGTPQFMAPEVYEEDYDKSIDIYSFGMCMIEMITKKTPYGECDSIPQVYRKICRRKKPDILYRIKYPNIRELIEYCIGDSNNRITINELIEHPFFTMDEYDNLSHFIYTEEEYALMNNSNEDENDDVNNEPKESLNENSSSNDGKIIKIAEIKAKRIIDNAKKKANEIIQTATSIMNDIHTIKEEVISDKDNDIDELLKNNNIIKNNTINSHEHESEHDHESEHEHESESEHENDHENESESD